MSDTAVKSPKRRVRPIASMAGSAPAGSGGRGGTTRRSWPRRTSSGSRATKASSRSAVPVRAFTAAGVSWASRWPAFIITTWSKRSASSM
nr:hypothetical protein [Azospirillum sp. 412522]